MSTPAIQNPENQGRISRVSPAKAPRLFLKPSRWIWIPYIWFFFAATRSLSTWVWGGSKSISIQDGNSADRWLMSALIVIGLFALRLRAERVRRILTDNKWIVVFLVYIALSIIWSSFPGISFRRGIRSIGTFVMVLMVLTEPSAREAVRILLARLYMVHIPLSVIVIKYFRNIGVTYNWSGVEEQWIGLSTDKNSLGQVAMCAGVFFLWQILREWPRRKLTLNVPMLALTLWILRGSKNVYSSTAILGFVFCIFVLLGFQLFRKNVPMIRRFVLGGTITAAFVVPLFYLAFALLNTTPVQVVVHASGRDMTFTDRNLIWMDVWNNASRNPVLGVGIGAYWVGTIGYDKYPMPNWSAKTPGWRPEEGHNGFLDVYAELGVVGVILLLILIGSALAGAFRDIERDFWFGSLRMVLLLGIILNNLTETSLLKGTHDLWLLFLILAVNLPQPNEKHPAEKRWMASQDRSEIEEQFGESKTLMSSYVSPTRGSVVC